MKLRLEEKVKILDRFMEGVEAIRNCTETLPDGTPIINKKKTDT
jgi:hypothetical protein